MQHYIDRGALQVAKQLDEFIEQHAIVDSGLELTKFWSEFETLLHEFVPQNKALLEERDSFQKKIDTFNKQNGAVDVQQQQRFLQEIGYLQQQPKPFTITTDKVDPEVATMAGPQLVVPINNPRYALNAANARWGSLYDALYGTDVIPQTSSPELKGYDPKRGQQVIDYAKNWLDQVLPLTTGSHKQVKQYVLEGDRLLADLGQADLVTLRSPEQLVGYQGNKDAPQTILLKHNGLHLELQFDPQHPIGKTDPANLKDIVIEAALSTIMDCEDSVAAVDADDKTEVYRAWLGLMQGNLTTNVEKNGKSTIRELAKDRQYIGVNGNAVSLKGRSLMFVRNVGHLMYSDAILFEQKPIPEGIMDAVITSLIGKHDLLNNSAFVNSQAGSVYIVKPKMHGPKEVAFTDALFARVERVLELPKNTIKMGIMDEERRTSVNLRACIAAAKSRVVFINTGFLDRTGDEIHTSMHLGPFGLKAQLKNMPWIQAYEQANVAGGLQSGLSGKAQIGKGMWPIPDNMAQMMRSKIQHPMAGANTAWVPSPTAATLHALHYHQVDVFAQQTTIRKEQQNDFSDMFSIPLMQQPYPDVKEIQQDLDNNVQGILGYVVRWVNQGIGCSKVPDIHNVGLMEDRATLRISSQHIANWLIHNIISEQQVRESLERMSALVDQQNESDPNYVPMGPNLKDSLAFEAASRLIFEGVDQPNGYTEPLLHEMRRQQKKCKGH